MPRYPQERRMGLLSTAPGRPVHSHDRAARCPSWRLGSGGLAKDPIHGRTADRALALGHVHAGLADLDRAFEVSLLFALHAVTVVRLGLCGHGVLLRGSFACGECDASAVRITAGHAGLPIILVVMLSGNLLRKTCLTYLGHLMRPNFPLGSEGICRLRSRRG